MGGGEGNLDLYEKKRRRSSPAEPFREPEPGSRLELDTCDPSCDRGRAVPQAFYTPAKDQFGNGKSPNKLPYFPSNVSAKRKRDGSTSESDRKKANLESNGGLERSPGDLEYLESLEPGLLLEEGTNKPRSTRYSDLPHDYSTYWCHECDYSGKYRALLMHIQRTHSLTTTEYRRKNGGLLFKEVVLHVCKICGKEISYLKDTLIRHLLGHGVKLDHYIVLHLNGELPSDRDGSRSTPRGRRRNRTTVLDIKEGIANVEVFIKEERLDQTAEQELQQGYQGHWLHGDSENQNQEVQVEL